MCVYIYVYECLVTSVVSDLVTMWTVARQAPLSMDSPSKNIRVGCHAFLQGILLTQGSNPCLMSPALTGRFFTTSATREAHVYTYIKL